MRFRTSGSMESISVVYTDSFQPTWDGVNHGHTQTTVTNTIGSAVGNTIRTWDVVTPNFRKRMSRGEIIVNAYKNERISRFNSINGIHARSNTLNPDGTKLEQLREGPQLTWMVNMIDWRRLSPRNLIIPDEIHRLTILAGTAARSKVGSADAEVLVMLAELRKTIRTLLNPLNNLNALLGRIQRAKSQVGNALSFSQYLGSEWLKYRYGIMPIMYDIQGIIQAVQRDKSKGIHVARGSNKTSAEHEDSPLIWSHGDIDTQYQDSFTDDFTVRAGLVYNAKLFVEDYLGLNLRSIPSAGWELIPFSFVVDWFANVQQYIAALAASGIADEKGGYLVTTRVRTCTRRVIGSSVARNPASSTLLREMSGSETIVERIKERSTGCPGPGLRSKIDLSQFNYRDKRVLDAFSLVAQKLRSIR